MNINYTIANENVRGSRQSIPPLALLALAVALSGCAAPLELTSGGAALTGSYTGQDASIAARDANGQQLVLGQSAGPDWWKLLGSPEIDALVAMGLQNNQTIEAARANMARAAQEAAAVNGGFAPQLSVDARATRGNGTVTGNSLRETEGVYRIGPTLSYELPMFGRRQQTAAYGAARVRRSDAELRAVRLSVSGNIVLRALEIASLRAQIAELGEMVKNGEGNLDILQQAERAGAVSKLDVIAAQNQLDQDRAQLPVYGEKLKHAQIALTVLVGKTPSEWQTPDLRLESLTLPARLPVAIPSELLRSRPDILVAEADIAVASAQIGIAAANMYPRIDLTLDIGHQGLLSGGAAETFFGLVGNIAVPIFNGGTLRARQKAAEEDYRSSLARYRGTVTTAFSQVGEAMFRLSTTSDKEAAERESLASANELVELTWEGYRAGKVDYLRVLSGLRAQQQAKLSYVEANRARYDASVSLLLASGAG